MNYKSLLLLTALPIPILTSFPTWASAVTYQNYAVASATQNDSGNTVLFGNPGNWLMIRPTPDAQGGNGFLKFDLSVIPNDSAIESVTLYLDWNSVNNAPLRL